MVGMIFAAGLGTRLKPWTDHHPKALAEVGGRPVLALAVEKLLSAGIDRIVVNTHHMADQIQDYIAASPYATHISISHEPILLDTGGGLRKALQLIGDEPVLLHNADILTDAPLSTMIEAYNKSRPDAMLLTDERATSRFLLFGSDGAMSGYYRSDNGRITPDRIPDEALKGDLAGRHFCGVHIVSPSMYPALKNRAGDDIPFSITDFYRSMAGSCRILCHDREQGSQWFDIGNPENLAAANHYFTRQQ